MFGNPLNEEYIKNTSIAPILPLIIVFCFYLLLYAIIILGGYCYVELNIMLEEKPQQAFIIFILMILIFEFIWIFFTIPLQIKLGGIAYPDPRLTYTTDTSWSAVAPRILITVIVFLVQSAILGLLSYYSFRASKIVADRIGLSILYFFYFVFTLFLASLAIAVGHISFYFLRISIIYGDPIGMIYVVSLTFSLALTPVAPYFLMNFGSLYARSRTVSKTVNIILFGIITLNWILMCSPYNWYAMYSLNPNVLDIRPITDGISLLINISIVLWLVKLFMSKYHIEQDPIKRGRILTMLIGLILYLAFFIWFVIEQTLYRKYLWIYAIGYGLASLALIFIYLGLIPPKFLLEYFEKKLKK